MIRRLLRAGRLRRRIARAAACLVVLGCISGCAGEAGARARHADADTASWSLGTPLVHVGGGAGQEWDRVYGGVLRSDGSMVVGNSGTAELRFIGRDGRPLRTAGRSGAGPGEFGSINWIATLPGDSLVAFDVHHQRFSLWSPAGAFQRGFTSQAPPGPVRPVGVMADGSILIAIEGRYDPRAGAGVVRDSMQVLRMDRTGRVIAPLRTLPGAEWLVFEDPTSFRTTQLPFGRTGHLAVTGNQFVYGSSETGRLTVYDASGRQLRTIELGLRPREVPREEVSAFLSEVQDRSERSALARHYRDGAKGSAPLFTALRGDGEGNIWIRLPPRAGADSVKWMSITPRGERRGSVRMHTRWLPLDIRAGSVLLRESDGDGVQRVVIRKVVS